MSERASARRGCPETIHTLKRQQAKCGKKRDRIPGIVIALTFGVIPHAMKMLCISLVVGSFVAGCVGSGRGKSRAYTVNGVAAGTTIAGMLIASQVMKVDESSDQLDMGPTLAYVWGGLTLATLTALSLITAQMPESENTQREEAGVAKLELIPTPPSIHLD